MTLSLYPHQKNIYHLLDAAYARETLLILLYDQPTLQRIYQRLSAQRNSEQVIGQIILQAQQMQQLDHLLALTKSQHPTLYAQHQPYWTETPVDELPDGSDVDETPDAPPKDNAPIESDIHLDNRSAQHDQYNAERDINIYQQPSSFWRWVAVVALIVTIATGLSTLFGSYDKLIHLIVPEVPSATPTPTATQISTPTSTPLAIATASRDEILIIVADFHLAQGMDSSEPEKKILRHLQQTKEFYVLEQVRIGTEPTRLTADERAQAEFLGHRYRANIFIWGEETTVQTIGNFLDLKASHDLMAFQQISTAPGRSALSSPKAYEQFILEGLPEKITLLVLKVLGIVIAQEGDDALALRILEDAVAPYHPETSDDVPEALNSALAEVYFVLGWLYQRQNKPGQALMAYDQTIQLNPAQAAAFNNRGTLYAAQRQLELALDDYDAALDLNPNFIEAYNNRGLIYDGLGRFSQALEDYEKALALKPDFAEAYRNRGLVYYHQQDYEQALAAYNQALALQADDALGYNNRGAVYADLGKWDLALDDYNTALAYNPNSAFPYKNRGFLYHQRGDLVAALDDYTQAIALNPNYDEAYYNQGILYAEQGDVAQAIANYDTALRLNLDFTDAYYNRGLLYYQTENYAAAIADFSHALRLDGDRSDAYYQRGAAYALQGNYQQAVNDFTEALQRNPADVAAYASRGQVYLTMANYQRAIADFDQALALNPNLAAAYYNRGIAYQEQGNLNQAINSLNTGLALDTNQFTRQQAETLLNTWQLQLETLP